MAMGVGVGATYRLDAEDEVTVGGWEQGREGQEHAGKTKDKESVVEAVLPHLRQGQEREEWKKNGRV